jgi:hypothetical protein
MSIKTNLAAAALAVPLSIGAVPPVLNNFFGATEAQAQTVFDNKSRVTVKQGQKNVVIRASRNNKGGPKNNGCGANRPIGNTDENIALNNEKLARKGITLENAGGGFTLSDSCGTKRNPSKEKATLTAVDTTCKTKLGRHRITGISGSFTLIVEEGSSCKGAKNNTNARAERESVQQGSGSRVTTTSNSQRLPYQKNSGSARVTVKLGSSEILKGVRHKNCKSVPNWNGKKGVKIKLPKLSNGVFYDAGVGTTFSTGCGNKRVPARAVGFQATSKGRSSGEIFGDTFSINVK